MPRSACAFRQRDVKAAIKAVEAAGHAVERIEIAPDGRIIVIPARASDAAVGEFNEWDDDREGAAHVRP